MFSKKIADVKKSTAKIQDAKKDVATRFKHLKIILDNSDQSEAKGLFETNFSHIYHILYDTFVQAETNLRQRVHKAHKEDLDAALWTLEQLLCLLPELVHKRWQVHSLGHIINKLLHHGNTIQLRRQAIRYFLMWYQALNVNAPEHVHDMFKHLVPGFHGNSNNNDSGGGRHGGRANKMASMEEEEELELGEEAGEEEVAQQGEDGGGCYGDEGGDDDDNEEEGSKPRSVFFFSDRPSSGSSTVAPSSLAPIEPCDPLTALLAPSVALVRDDAHDTVQLFDALLEQMVATVVPLDWHDGHVQHWRCFRFLFARFVDHYLPQLFPRLDRTTSLYAPNLDLPTLRRPEPETVSVTCRVAFIKWITAYMHQTKQRNSTPSNNHNGHSNNESTTANPTPINSSSAATSQSCHNNQHHHHDDEQQRHLHQQQQESTHASLDSNVSLTSINNRQLHSDGGEPPPTTTTSPPPATATEQQQQEDNEEDLSGGGNLVRSALCASRAHVDLLHEIYRQAFLLNFEHACAIRKTIALYKDLIQANVAAETTATLATTTTTSAIPLYALEPLEEQGVTSASSVDGAASGGAVVAVEGAEVDSKRPTLRLRNDSYIGAIQQQQQQLLWQQQSQQPGGVELLVVDSVAIRAGMQNVLQLFVTHAANVFLMILEEGGGRGGVEEEEDGGGGKQRRWRGQQQQLQNHNQQKVLLVSLLEEQTDACKRVLNIYRYMVMHTRMDNVTWEQLLMVLLQITALVLGERGRGESRTSNQQQHGQQPPLAPPQQAPIKHRRRSPLGGKLAPAIFQTLIVTWIKANLNVAIGRALWDRFLHVLTALTDWEELITEWAKTMETLTRVLARHVYNLDLTDLPLDRIVVEQRSKRAARKNAAASVAMATSISTRAAATRDGARGGDVVACDTRRDDSSSIDGGSGGDGGVSLRGNGSRRMALLSRSCSETNLVGMKDEEEVGVEQGEGSRRRRRRRRLETFSLGGGGGGSQRKKRSLSLDNVNQHPQMDTETSSADDHLHHHFTRTPSPAPSSGIESGSIKDSPLDVLNDQQQQPNKSQQQNNHKQQQALLSSSSSAAGGGGHQHHHQRRRGIVCGGTTRGWVADGAVVLWKRMLGALGDVNRIRDARLHARVFTHLIKLTETLVRIRANQGVLVAATIGDTRRVDVGKVGDEEEEAQLTPPLTLILPWCFGALTQTASRKERDDEFAAGRMAALRLLCTIVVRATESRTAIFLPHFYRALHVALTGGSRAAIYTTLKHLGAHFLSLQLPGATLLLLDLVQACDATLLASSTDDDASNNNNDINSNSATPPPPPRTDAVAILGAILSIVPDTLNGSLAVLQPDGGEEEVEQEDGNRIGGGGLRVISCTDVKEHVVGILLRAARSETVAAARCVALSALGGYAYRALARDGAAGGGGANVVVTETVRVLLETLRGGGGGQLTAMAAAVDVLLLLCDHARLMCKRWPRVAASVVRALCTALGQQYAAIGRRRRQGRGEEEERVGGGVEAKPLCNSLLLCLGEWCVRIGPEQLSRRPPHDAIVDGGGKEPCLLVIVFETLNAISIDEAMREEGAAAARGQGSGGNGDFTRHQTDVSHSSEGGGAASAVPATSATKRSSQPQRDDRHRAAVRLCARSVLAHLVNHLGHFPTSAYCGAACLTSLVVEEDDCNCVATAPQQTQRGAIYEQVSGNVAGAATAVPPSNLQLFVLTRGVVASLIELPALDNSSALSPSAPPGGGVIAGLKTATRQVRVLLRDLAGKSCWDASVLYRKPEFDRLQSSSPPPPEGDSTTTTEAAPAAATPFEQQQQQQRVVMRQRPPNVLPDAANAAPDYDQLHDLLQYVGYTSPEMHDDADRRLNEPPPSIASTLYYHQRHSSTSATGGGSSNVVIDYEHETIATVIGERNAEADRTRTARYRDTTAAQRVQPPQAAPPPGITPKPHQLATSNLDETMPDSGGDPFRQCRALFSQLGLAGRERRQRTHPLTWSDRLSRELRNLDGQRCRETHKVAVVYVAAGQEEKHAILTNGGGSAAYEQFLAALAWEVELETHTGFLGGLRQQQQRQQRQDPDAANGVTAPYVATCFTEVVFHVATRMPGDTPEAVLNKTRHLGNDEVHVVWSEHSRDYRRDIIATEFCDVLIVIYPLGNQLHRVTVDCKPEVPYFGVLYDEAIVDGTVLAALIRTTVICASRAKRTTLPFYQQYYEERARSLDTIMTRHRDAVTYEDFVSRVYSPPPIATNNNNMTTLTSTPPSSGGHSTITTTASAAAPSIGNSLSDSNNSGAISCAATHTLDSRFRTSNQQTPPTSTSTTTTAKSVAWLQQQQNLAGGGGATFETSSSSSSASPRPLKKLGLKPLPRRSLLLKQSIMATTTVEGGRRQYGVVADAPSPRQPTAQKVTCT